MAERKISTFVLYIALWNKPPICVIKWINKKNNFYKQGAPGVYEAMRWWQMISYHDLSIILSRKIAIIDSLINALMRNSVYVSVNLFNELSCLWDPVQAPTSKDSLVVRILFLSNPP